MFVFQSNRQFSLARIPVRTRPARAFSLLEVAIALAIFVFGALAVVQIFPGALKVIGTGGDRQNAVGLNRATLARIQNNPPLATYDTGDDLHFKWQDGILGLAPEPRAVLASARRGYSLPRNNMADIDRSALGSLRAVVGEPATVQEDVNGHLFVLTQFPIFNDTEIRVARRTTIEGATVDATGLIDDSGARDTATGEPFVAPASPRYYATYRFRYTAGGAMWGVSEAPTNGKQVVPPPGAVANSIAAGQVPLVYQENLTPTPLNASAANEGDNKRGFVDLSALSPPIPPLKAGDTVYLDYQADWGWLLQTGVPDAVPEEVPTGATRPRQIALGAPFIEDRAANAVYTLCQTTTGGKTKPYIESWGENTPTLSGAQKLYSPTPSDLRAGRLTFETDTPGETFAGARVAFRTRDGWAQQLSVAASAYKPFGCGPNFTDPVPTPASNWLYYQNGEPWRDYVLSGNTLYFHASEAGKGVLVTYSYKDGGGSTITLRDRLLSIEDDPIQPSGLPANFAPSTFASQLQLTEADGTPITNLISITQVRGASVAVRTAWLDGARYTQSFLSAIRSGAGAEAMQ